QAILGIFPISGVELRVREPLNSSATTALEALDEVSALRDEENPGTHVSYYGMFRIAETLEEYCVGNCVLGASVVGEGANPRAGVGVGIGYTGDASARTFVHELGHVYGRQHSPCGVAGDPEFPYSGGRTGVWGYDLGQKTLMPPSLGDFMGYCEPLWVSDYVFGHLATFVGTVNAGVALLQRGEPARFRTILLERGARPRFGRSRRLSGEPPGKPEEAVAYARDGAATSTVVYRSSLADVEAELVYVPDPSDRDWTHVRLRSGELVEY
ncbi:MAG TPA: M66 family metalloprotease, partial [Polyangiaceae bacterium]